MSIQVDKAVLAKVPFVNIKSGKDWIKKGTLPVSGDVAKSVGIAIEAAQALFAIVIKKPDQETLEVPDDMTQKDAKLFLKAFAELRKIWGIHLKKAEEDKIAAENAKAAKAAEKEAAKLAAVEQMKKNTLAATKGYAIASATAETLMSSVVKNLQTAVGKNFVVSATGLTVKEGAKISEEDAAILVSTMANASENSGKVNAAVNWALGDAVNFVEDNFQNGTDIITAVASANGQSKHTIQQASRVAKAFPPDKRIGEFTFTHHQEILNYGKNIPAKKLEKVIEAAREAVTLEAEGVTASGEKVKQTKPITVKKLRGMLQEASKAEGKGNVGKKESKTPATPSNVVAMPGVAAPEVVQKTGFIYITNQGDVFKSSVLSEKACASDTFAICIDLGAMRLLDADAAEADAIEDLDAEWLPEEEKAPEPVKAETPTLAKKKKAAAKKEEPAPVAASGDDNEIPE